MFVWKTDKLWYNVVHMSVTFNEPFWNFNKLLGMIGGRSISLLMNFIAEQSYRTCFTEFTVFFYDYSSYFQWIFVKLLHLVKNDWWMICFDFDNFIQVSRVVRLFSESLFDEAMFFWIDIPPVETSVPNTLFEGALWLIKWESEKLGFIKF